LKLALFGGAFDPIHNAHIRIAKEAIEQCGLDRVLFIPAANPPHKSIHAPYEDRYRMVELALAGESTRVPAIGGRRDVVPGEECEGHVADLHVAVSRGVMSRCRARAYTRQRITERLLD
jgi:cytidyltransferase-like protein